MVFLRKHIFFNSSVAVGKLESFVFLGYVRITFNSIRERFLRVRGQVSLVCGKISQGRESLSGSDNCLQFWERYLSVKEVS